MDKYRFSYSVTAKRGFLICVSLFVLLSSGCKSEKSETGNSSEQSPPPQPVSVKPTPVKIITPLEERPDDENWLGEQWRNFFKSGRYRVITTDEIKLSEVTKQAMTSPPWSYYETHPYMRWCQGIGVIVVDTTRSDDKRFGLVLFPSEYIKSAKKPVWLLRNQDLSKTVLHQVSCSMFIRVEAADGTRKSYEIRWDEKNKRFIY